MSIGFCSLPLPVLPCHVEPRCARLVAASLAAWDANIEVLPTERTATTAECRLRARRLAVAVTIRIFCPSIIFLLFHLLSAFGMSLFVAVCCLLFVVYLAVACYYYDVKNNKRGDSSNLKNHHHHHNYRPPRRQKWPGNCCACCCCLGLTASQRGFGLGQEGEGYPLDTLECWAR